MKIENLDQLEKLLFRRKAIMLMMKKLDEVREFVNMHISFKGENGAEQSREIFVSWQDEGAHVYVKEFKDFIRAKYAAQLEEVEKNILEID